MAPGEAGGGGGGAGGGGGGGAGGGGGGGAGGGGGVPPTEIGLQRRITELRQRYGASAADPAAFEQSMAEIQRLAVEDPPAAKRRLDAFDQLAESRGLTGESEPEGSDLITDLADAEEGGLTIKEQMEPDVRITDPETGLETMVDPKQAAMQAGNVYDEMRRFHGSENRVTELFVDGPMGRRRVDAYEPGLEIISGKSLKTGQLAEIDYFDALAHLQELSTSYRPGSTIADVPTTPPHLRGKTLAGRLVLEVPPQTSPVPELILKEAAARKIMIRDTSGWVYSIDHPHGAPSGG